MGQPKSVGAPQIAESKRHPFRVSVQIANGLPLFLEPGRQWELFLPFLSPDTEINSVLKGKAHILFNGLRQDEDQQKKQIPEVSLLSQASSGAPQMFSTHFFSSTEA